MRTKQYVLDLFVFLVEENDLNLLKKVPILNREGFSRIEIETITEIFNLLNELYRSYDFFKSPLFNKSIKNKSSKFIEMKIRMESAPLKVKNNKNIFKLAISDLLLSNELYEYVEEENHLKINRVKSLLSKMPCPDRID